MMKKSFTIHTPTGDSHIKIADSALDEVKKHLETTHPEAAVAIITDTNVGNIYHDELNEAFPEALLIMVEAGEESKTLETAGQLCEDLLEDEFGRNDVIIGFGGGMVTDLAGFVASIYMRGVPYIAVPTSLLAMVDAAIGGKTGVDLVAKNSVGTFYPAQLIAIEPRYLDTLPPTEVNSGMAEVIKYAGVLDASLVEDLEAEELHYTPMISKCVASKVKVVNSDLKERGLRKSLNYGHTFGHAVEHLSNFSLSHGEAISIGIKLANRVGESLKLSTSSTRCLLENLLKKYCLTLDLPPKMKVEDLVNLIKRDKKMKGDKITFVVMTELGKHKFVELEPEALIELATSE
jgi:3-dehydroquinate synthase